MYILICASGSQKNVSNLVMPPHTQTHTHIAKETRLTLHSTHQIKCSQVYKMNSTIQKKTCLYL